MNSRERASVAHLVDAFSRLQPSIQTRESVAEAYRQLGDFGAAQLIDFEGHLDLERGAEVIVSPDSSRHEFILKHYLDNIPEHPYVQPRLWQQTVRLRTNNSVTMSDYVGASTWKKSGFRNNFCGRMDFDNVYANHILGPDGNVKYGVFLPLFSRSTISARQCAFLNWLAPFVSRGLNNSLFFDALAEEALAAAAGFELTVEPLVLLRGDVPQAFSPSARRILELDLYGVQRNAALSEFIRLSHLARLYAEPVLWNSARGEAFRLLSQSLPDGTTVVRLMRCAALAQSSIQKKFSLTSAQSHVAEWLKHGLSDKQIAQKLNCSPNTIRVHLRAIYMKLGVSGRVEAWNMLSQAT